MSLVPLRAITGHLTEPKMSDTFILKKYFM